ncbi:MAG: DUF1127 domain-containing protein [Pseudomonadales bacterium]
MFWLADALIGTQSQRWHDINLSPNGDTNVGDTSIGDARLSYECPVGQKGGRAMKSMTALTSVVRKWRERRATVRDLRALNDHLLRDIGITRSEIDAYSSSGLLTENRHWELNHGYSNGTIDLARARNKIRPVKDTIKPAKVTNRNHEISEADPNWKRVA